jgi:hypothetical protein
MRRRSCSSLLAVLLLTLCSTAALWGQTSTIPTKAGVDPRVLEQQTVEQPAPAHPQSLDWVGSTPFRPKSPGQFAGPGSGPSSPPGGAPTFPQLARTAGTIFAGTVTRIEPGPSAGGSAVATVAITFRVERPLRGAVSGGSLTILEWLGLWSSGQRYAVGEQVLLFLYPASKIGLTSAVGGALGQFRLDSAGGILPSERQFAAFRTDPLFAGQSAGRSRIAFNDFAQALRRSVGEQALE